MNPIPVEILEETWEKMVDISSPEVSRLIDRMTNEQPLILAYLMAVGDDLFNEDERELMLFLGVVIWQVMLRGESPLPPITEETIDDVEDANFKMLEYLEGESEADFLETTTHMLENYNQSEILAHVLDGIMEESEESDDMTGENQGMMMIFLKTVIDCFDR